MLLSSLTPQAQEAVKNIYKAESEYASTLPEVNSSALKLYCESANIYEDLTGNKFCFGDFYDIEESLYLKQGK